MRVAKFSVIAFIVLIALAGLGNLVDPDLASKIRAWDSYTLGQQIGSALAGSCLPMLLVVGVVVALVVWRQRRRV